jgi:hypothetical protein
VRDIDGGRPIFTLCIERLQVGFPVLKCRWTSSPARSARAATSCLDHWSSSLMASLLWRKLQADNDLNIDMVDDGRRVEQSRHLHVQFAPARRQTARFHSIALFEWEHRHLLERHKHDGSSQKQEPLTPAK